MKTGLCKRSLVRAAAMLCLAFSPFLVAAQAIVHDIEPNNKPDDFQRISGAVRIIGTMAGQDQDGFLWKVDEDQSLRPWNFTLQGIPGALTVVDVFQLEYAEDGQTLIDKKKFFTLGSRDGSRPVSSSDLWFEPGEYVLGFAHAGRGGSRPPISAGSFTGVDQTLGGQPALPPQAGPQDVSAADDEQPAPANGYRLDIVEGPTKRLSRSPAAGSPRERAASIARNESKVWKAQADQSWYRFTVDEKAAGQRWGLAFNTAVGQPLKVSLQDQQGTELASTRVNAQGQAQLPDLSLPQGGYFLSLDSQPGAMHVISLYASGLKVEGEEAEPNNSWRTANQVDLFQGVSARLQVANDVDMYRFELTEAQVDQRLAIVVETGSAGAYNLCLLDDLGKKIRCRKVEGNSQFNGLALEAGQYGVQIERGTAGMAYRLSLKPDGPHDIGREAEPNDSRPWAHSILLGKRVRGSFDGNGDVDFYRVDVDEQPQMWRFQVNGEGLHELHYYDGRGRRLQTVRAGKGQHRLMLDSLYLAPGTHYLSIQGRSMGDYVLLSRALGMPAPHTETEPNDNAAHMLPLQMGQTRTGGFHDAGDKDMYYFQLAAHEHIRLRVQAPLEDTVKMRVELQWEGQVLKTLELGSRQDVPLEGVYPPGSYVVTLSTNQATDDQYRLGLERLPRYGCSIDCEPNHNAAFSNPLPADGRIVGRADPVIRGDTDWYALPVRAHDTEWQFVTASTAQLAMRLNQQQNAQRLKRKPVDEPYQISVPANVQSYLIISPKDDYEIQALPDGQALAVQAPLEASAWQLSLDFPVQQVAAYARLGQVLEGTIQLRNSGSETVVLTLDADTSDLRWQVKLSQSQIELPGDGAAVTVPLRIQVPNDAAARPVHLSVKAAHESGAQLTAETQLEVHPDAAPVQAGRHWTVPAALRGGLNLASTSLGGRVLTEGVANLYRQPDSLIDGTPNPVRGFEFRQRKLPYEASVTLELAGDASLPIAGFALHPFGNLPMHQAPQHFSVALSNDGIQYDIVLQDTLQPVRREQHFVLSVPRPARFARLTVHQNHRGEWDGNTGLGEWRVIAQPGSALPGADPFNLADPAHGGHVVYASPSVRRNGHWIDPDNRHRQDGLLSEPKGGKIEWVLGFHENRAARIDRIVWGQPIGKKEPLPEEVEVQVSLYGPVGPWQSLGRFQPQSEADAEWRLSDPVWARYMRFELLSASDKHRALAIPTAVRVYETAVDEQYLSILGLWEDNPQSVYEFLHAAVPPPVLDTQALHISRDTPQILPAGSPATGQVQLGIQEHWYQVRMPDHDNQLDIHLSDPFYLKAALAVETPTGEPVSLQAVQGAGNQRHWVVSADPGSELLIKVFEPPRNVIFAWDTSGSVAAYHEQIYNALREYARGLQPGRDMANLLPFDGRLQLQDWQSDPYLMMQAVNEHQGTDSSSAESTLITASRALAQRSGSRTIVLVTDAATTIDDELWQALEEGRPQIMAVDLSAGGGVTPDPIGEKRLMLNWSRVNGGHYSFAHDVNDMAHAFERTSVLLRQPAPYQLRVEASYVEPPADGALRVVAGQAVGGKKGASSIRPGPATAIILDASGSMLQRLGGERRIEIAKRGLMRAIAEQIPAGTPVSLRVFGHKEADSCRSDLEIPLQTLDVAAAGKIISRIQAKNLARTPIADSLSLVRQDLAQAQGPRTIVLVTDGEETCDGDPEAVIRELISEGYDVRLNIIGFALDDPILEQIFSAWAELGGGEYFSAADKAGFDQAVGQALQVHYTVLNAAGQEVAQGQVDGEPVALPPGNYQVRVGLVPELMLEALVETEATTTLQMD